MNASAVAGDARRHGRRARNHSALDLAIRLGIVSYGIVHLTVAWLALQLSWGRSSGQASGSGALRTLAQQPMGRILLWVVAIGFLALVVWQLLEAARGHNDEDGAKRTAKRLGSLGKAVLYGVLGATALSLTIGAGSSSSGSTEETWTARLMNMPGGQLLVAAVALGVVCYGIFEIGLAITATFLDKLTPRGQARDLGRLVKMLGRAGYASKGVAVIIIGGLLAWAAATHDAQKAGGLDEALKTMLDQPFGPYLLTVVALGIGCFGLFCFAWARHLDRTD